VRPRELIDTWLRPPSAEGLTERLSTPARVALQAMTALTVVYIAGRIVLPAFADRSVVEGWRLGPGLLIYGLAAFLCWWRSIRIRRDRAAWRWCAAAITLFALGTVLNKLFGTASSSPVAGHVAWIGFYTCLYVGLLLMARSALKPFPWSHLLDALIAVLVLASALLTISEFVGSGGYRSWEAPLAIAYPALDLLLIGFIWWIGGAGSHPEHRRWRPIVWGLSFVLAGDLLLLALGVAGALDATAAYTALYPIAMACLGRSAWLAPPRPSILRPRGVATLHVPLLGSVVAFAFVIAGVFDLVGALPASVAAVALVLIIIRGGLVYRDLFSVQLGQRFERGFEDAGIGMALIDATATWVRVNPALAAVLGTTPSALIGRPILERLVPADRAGAAILIDQVRGEGGRLDPTDLEIVTSGGTHRHLLMAGDVIRDHGAAPHLFLQVRDVTPQRRADRFAEVLAGLSRAALASSDVDTLLQSVSSETNVALGAPVVATVLAAERGPVAKVVAAPGMLRAELRDALALAEHPVAPALAAGIAVHWQDLAPGDGPTAAGLVAAELESLSVVPVVPAIGPPAALCVGYETARSSTAPDEQRFLESIANLVAAALERSRREALAHHEALHDALTGLANRTLLGAHIVHASERARREGGRIGGVLIDLDRFKNINDTLGHIAGDALLVQVAERLVEETRGGDLVARLGGDEFVIVFDRPESTAALETLAARLVDAFKRPFVVDERELFVGASVGIAVVDASEASTEALLRDADVAMYRAKAGGGGQYFVFDAELRAELVARVETERDLRHAVDRGELRLALQPQIHLDGVHPVSFEALVRWARPGVGLVTPGHFVQVAEDTGLIVPLGTWVLRETLQWASRATLTHGYTPTVSVNVSGRQLTDDLPSIVAAALADSGVPPQCLCLELTESMLIADPQAVEVLTRLRAMGVALSLDDFGTGWSSLAALQRHPVDELKLDRSMITALGIDDASAAITRAAVEMALALGITVVAEGIERRDQLDAVRALGCQVAQGYLFAKPLDPEAADAYLTARSWESLLRPLVRRER
jgi:diguanylate cyclase (GGDEF)-like protein/PAS domain S-box-containing protein